VIAARDLAKGNRALAKLVNIGAGRCELLEIDLANSASIRTAAKAAGERFGPINALINNAGVMQTPKQQTADGFEMQFGTNHLGHFLWTALMMERLDTEDGRVVTVSSIAHKYGRIQFGNLMMESGYDPTQAYLNSKLANLMFALELHRRLDRAGSSIKSIACHPGYSDTPLQGKVSNPLMKAVYSVSNAVIAQPQLKGAYPTALSAADDRAVSGGYFGPTDFFDIRGSVGDAAIVRRAMDEEVARRLWDASEELVGQVFPV